MQSNSQTSQLAQVTPVLPAGLIDVREDTPAPPGLPRQIHALLRGRYWLAVLLGVLGMAGGAAAGYFLTKPVYRSTGLIRVQAYMPPILFQNEENGSLSAFDSFINTQLELIQGQRVTDMAMDSSDWKALGRGLAPRQVVQFRESLSAARPKGSEILVVAFEDHEPKAAQVAVRSVVDTYEKLYGERAVDGVNERTRVLEERARTLEAELKSYSNRANNLAGEYGSPEALQQVYQAKLLDLQKLEGQLRRAELDVAFTKSAQQDPGPQLIANEPVEVLAQRVPELQRLLQLRSDIERSLRLNRARLGDKHRSVIEADAQLSVVNQEIDDLMVLHQRLQAESAGADGISRTLAQLQQAEQAIRQVYEAEKTTTLELGGRSRDIDRLNEQAETIKSSLAETKARIESNELERKGGGRIIIESRGDMPVAPAKDKRTQFAVAGALGAGGVGVALVMLLGYMDRRVRLLEHVQQKFGPRTRVLGVLPQLPDDLEDAESAMLAAHGVHTVRTAIQGRHRQEERPVITVTSPSPGSGKTSLTVALAMSFAASGSRVLMIDCDIIGGGLTAKLKNAARRRLGHILRRSGVITSEQLVAALKAPDRGERPLGETLVALGHATDEQIQLALEAQRTSQVGLMNALAGDSVAECIVETGVRGLFLMPLGAAERFHAGELSHKSLRRVIDSARKWFDVILIDTGPILGSLEAAIAARVSDEVLLTIARGEVRTSVERSLEQLAAAGSEVTGVVFNRAATPDIMRSGFSSSLSREADSGLAPPDRLPVIEHKQMKLGPIGSAVAAIAELPRRHAMN